MPRRNRPQRPAEPRPVGGHGWARAESGPDGEWLVRSVSGAATTKTYRCPGCDHEIRPGTPHVVAWPGADHGSVEDRRHWHQGCWNSRGRRGPSPRRW
ncbi:MULTISPECIES: hypothetical protein [Saccharothrix]|uniref:ATP/GTP-binding protein n=1 Tax=Saccharothrix yanglingensis TaxID=659496 RepID=A0ABU0X254_9PSEU|nr:MULTISPECIES: hypothetical protein [Saccharothrix]MBY8847402.1 hypothetical protein [Saccharothrix sp. MB29]MDQ2586092.1 hypothetical protein [Saccharothrix yanglingensis]MDU0294884.1 hypothetical protein [Saccharothrix longispora]